MRFIDTHCHLGAPELGAGRATLIARAKAAGVVAAIAVGEHYEDNLRVLELAAAEPFVLPALGHHPCQLERAREDVPRTLRLLEENRARVVAIGEVGLDYRRAELEAERAEQRAVFRQFIEASRRLDLPLSVHSRSAGHYVIEMLAEHGPVRAALHAFDGKVRYALRGAALGLYFSLPATVLVSQQKQKVACALPLERLLLESDAPALGPAPDRPSEPALCAEVARAVAELRGEALERVAAAAYENSLTLFRLALPAG
ncbi:MAG: TatD family hydrolase [Deltaproteobacteria bacterium]|nr:TatD family hydrolase [Deltaproteobacteria bacterium]